MTDNNESGVMDESDIKLLKFLHDRLIHVHGENENFDYMHGLRRVIDKTYITPAMLEDLEKIKDALRSSVHHAAGIGIEAYNPEVQRKCNDALAILNKYITKPQSGA